MRKSWELIFYEYLETGLITEKRLHLVSPTCLERIASVIASYIDYETSINPTDSDERSGSSGSAPKRGGVKMESRKDDRRNRNNKNDQKTGDQGLLDEAKEFLYFLKTHLQDPFSVFLGQIPSKTAVEMIINETVCTDEEFLLNAPCSLSQLYRLLNGWANNDPKVSMTVGDFATALRGVSKLQSGDLVLVDIGGQYRYARYCSIGDFLQFLTSFYGSPDVSPSKGSRSISPPASMAIGLGAKHVGTKSKRETWTANGSSGDASNKNHVQLLMDPSGTMISVHRNSIYPITARLLQHINDSYFRSMSELSLYVDHPANHLFIELDSMVQKFVIEHTLHQFPECMTLLKRAQQRECSLMDLKDLKELINVFDALVVEPPLDLMAKIDSSISTVVKTFLHSLGRYDLFRPARSKILQRIEGFTGPQLVSSQCKQMRKDCAVSLQLIEIQHTELMDGTRKNQLSAWWLTLIRETVHKKLKSKSVFLFFFSLFFSSSFDQKTKKKKVDMISRPFHKTTRLSLPKTFVKSN